MPQWVSVDPVVLGVPHAAASIRQASEAELHQLVSAALESTWRRLRKPAELTIGAVDEVRASNQIRPPIPSSA